MTPLLSWEVARAQAASARSVGERRTPPHPKPRPRPHH